MRPGAVARDHHAAAVDAQFTRPVEQGLHRAGDVLGLILHLGGGDQPVIDRGIGIAKAGEMPRRKAAAGIVLRSALPPAAVHKDDQRRRAFRRAARLPEIEFLQRIFAISDRLGWRCHRPLRRLPAHTLLHPRLDPLAQPVTGRGLRQRRGEQGRHAEGKEQLVSHGRSPFDGKGTAARKISQS